VTAEVQFMQYFVAITECINDAENFPLHV